MNQGMRVQQRDEAPEAIDREEKHAQLDYAINRLDHVIGAARRLRNRITGNSEGEPPNTLAEVYQSPTLEALLNHGPDRIDDKNGAIQAILEEIERALYG